MARSTLPYPPSPTVYPADLTAVGRDGTTRAVLLLAGAFAFLFVYVGIILACFGVILWMMFRLDRLPFPLLWIVGAVFCAGVALILLKGLFKRGTPDRTMHLEITEDEHPRLFAFIERLTEEIGAPMPNRVFVTPEVTAAAMQELSLVNLVVPPKKNLLIGLGLVNTLTLSEFKAVLGHEFGHFSQKTNKLTAYVYITFRVMDNLIQGEDWLDRLLRDARRANPQDLATAGVQLAFVACVGGPVWVIRQALIGAFYALHLAYLSLSRQNEFHADRVAVSVAGSNAIVHALARLDFAETALEHAANDLETASQQKLYTNDLFLHHTDAAARLRKTKKKPRLGMPPALKTPAEGKSIQVFDEDEDTGIPEMWSTHPSNFDREENAKAVFVVAEDDERSPWILFSDLEELKERATYKFYRLAFEVKKSVKLSPAATVQAFLDDEYAEITYDKKYHGAYDERWLEPGKVDDLNDLVENEPWDAQRIARVHGRLYLELGRRAKDFAAVKKAARKIFRRNFGRRPRGRDRRELDDLEDEFKTLCEWFASFDRRVYLVHAHMARQAGGGLWKDISHRYDFHLALQDIQRQMYDTHEAVGDVLAGLQHYGEQLAPDFGEEFFRVLRDARKTLKHCLRLAEDLKSPALANVPAGTRCDQLIFDANLLRDMPETYVRVEWINKLLTQMGRMGHRADRIAFKSMGAILVMQDRLAAEWYGKAIPAAVVEDEPLPELIVVEEPRENP